MNKIFFAQNVKQLGNGYLYNGYSVINTKFATSGWSVPTNADWVVLQTYLGGSSVAGGKMKKTGIEYWTTPNTGATNSSGFTGIGSGYRLDTATFYNILNSQYLWSSSNIGSNLLGYSLYYGSAALNNNPSGIDMKIGCSVRLIKDSTTLSDGETSTMTDEDGNVYDTICIGTQEWTVQNWKCTKLNDGTSLTKVTSATTWAAASTGDEYYCAYDNDESNV